MTASATTATVMRGWTRAPRAALAAVASLALAGCGGAAVSPELHDARLGVARAGGGPARRLEADELEAAERILARAEAEGDGSAREAHLAYLAERQALLAAAHARAAELAQQVERDRLTYGEEVTAIARRTGEPLEATRERLARSELSLQQQQALLAEREQELALEQMEQAAEQARSQEALESLRTVALVETGPGETVVTLSGEVLFARGQATLRSEASARLSAVADAILATEDQEIAIEAHTGAQGSELQNRRLSQRRAESVRAFLASEGVPVERMRATGQGESEPIATNGSSDGRASNSRVEIVVRPASVETEPTAAPPSSAPPGVAPPSGTPPSGTPPGGGARP